MLHRTAELQESLLEISHGDDGHDSFPRCSKQCGHSMSHAGADTLTELGPLNTIYHIYRLCRFVYAA